MGCVSSKIITRSRSFQEELSSSLKRRTNGFPLLEGLIKSMNDDLYQNLQHFSTKSEESSTHLDTINLWELMDGLEEEEDEEEEEEEEEAQEDEEEEEEEEEEEGEGENQKKRFSISWKFHTVEEYDALLASNQDEQLSDVAEDQDIKTIDCVDEKCFTEKGKKMKSIRNELKPLELQSFEFSGTGSLREWIEAGGQVFSPGSYHTPKFGRDSISRRRRRSKDGENGEEDDDDDVLFDPELVAGIEEAMRDLTEEEEDILEQMLEKISRK